MGTGFKQLKVWAEARDLAVDIYRLSSTGSLSKDFTLRDKLRRAAVSAPSNIAEGGERDTGQRCRAIFLHRQRLDSRIRTQLEIANRVDLITAQQLNSLDTRCVLIAKMLGALIKARSATFPPRP